jgi:hypothetical protein
MIITEKIKFTEYAFFKIFLAVYLKKRWWLIVMIWLFALLMFSKDEKDSSDTFFIYFAIFYPILIVVRFWMYANSKDNKLFLVERFFEIDENKFIGFLSDGTESTIKFEHFIRVVELKNIFLLYISKNQFIFIPKNSFQNNSDRVWFEQNIISKIKK